MRAFCQILKQKGDLSGLLQCFQDSSEKQRVGLRRGDIWDVLGLNGAREVDDSVALEIQFDEVQARVISGLLAVLGQEQTLFLNKIEALFYVALELGSGHVVSQLSGSDESFDIFQPASVEFKPDFDLFTLLGF